MRHRSAEDACAEYASAVAEVRALTSKIANVTCIRTDAWSKKFDGIEENDFDGMCAVGPRPDTCLRDLFNAPRGPEGDIDRNLLSELRADLCCKCAEAYEYVQCRKRARVRVGAVKRSVEAAGKRIAKERAA